MIHPASHARSARTDAWRSSLAAVRDQLFFSTFARTFAFTLLLEDSEVDEQFFEVNEQSSILSISGAGCSVVGALARRPRRIDVVDSNRHHLAVTALKVAAARRVKSYDEFYQLFGRGHHPRPEGIVADISVGLPASARSYWARNARMFRTSFYHHGLMGRAFKFLRDRIGTDSTWMRGMIDKSIEQREREIDQRFAPVLRGAAIATLLRSPVFMLTNGINFEQRTRNLQADRTDDVVELVLAFLRRIASTELRYNWIAWNATVGEFNHEEQAAVPPYLRRANHERSVGAATDVRFRHRNIFDVLAEAGPRTWTHMNVCDAIDWMPPVVQRRLLREAVRTMTDGGVFLCRSVEDRCVVEDLGMEKHLRRIEPVSQQASALDRSRLYRRVHFYRVVH